MRSDSSNISKFPSIVGKLPYDLLGVLPITLVFIVLLITPLATEIIYAFSALNEPFPSLNSIIYVLNDPLYLWSFIRTVIYIIIDIGIKFFVGLIAAVALRQVKGYKILWGVLLLPYAMPLVPSLYVWYCLYHPAWGFINYALTTSGLIHTIINFLGDPSIALYALIWAHAWRFTPLWMTILLAGLHGIPEEYYESAKIDGATPTRTFFRITLPLIKRYLLLNATLSLIWTSGEFVSIWVLTKGGPANSTHVLGSYAYWYIMAGGNFHVAAAALVCAFPMLLFLMAIFFRIMRWK
ncbi:MAG: sugar ABC transporter permease [Nitrososphaeria archaeon]